MKSFYSAIQFLTIIPVKVGHADEKKLPKAMIYFPLVGLLLGLVLAGTGYLLAGLNFDDFTINTILVVLLIILTGGLHLDGLADTFDGLSGGKDREEMLKIMRDPHIGAMGVLGLITVLLLKISFLSSVSVSLKTGSLILMCVLGRWSMVFAMFLFPYARRIGVAKVFIDAVSYKIFFPASIIALACVIAGWGLRGIVVFGIIAVSAYIIGRFINNRIKGITGDSLGAINELIEVITLFSICILERIDLWKI